MIINIKDGKVINKEQYFEFMLNIKDGYYEIKEYKKDRTNEQNRYLWGVVYKVIADSIGEDVDYIHGVMGMKFLVDNTKKSPYIKSTAKLNKSEFIDYVENIKNFVAQYNINIPEANIL